MPGPEMAPALISHPKFRTAKILAREGANLNLVTLPEPHITRPFDAHQSPKSNKVTLRLDNIKLTSVNYPVIDKYKLLVSGSALMNIPACLNNLFFISYLSHHSNKDVLQC